MDKLNLEIVTAERIVFSDEVDMVIAPGSLGQLGILPHHAPLLTSLTLGELKIKQNSEIISMAIGGGFLEVLGSKVVVLADSAERADEIDIARAEAAMQRAQQRLHERAPDADAARAEAALRRALVRLRVAQRRRRGGGGQAHGGAP